VINRRRCLAMLSGAPLTMGTNKIFKTVDLNNSLIINGQGTFWDPYNLENQKISSRAIFELNASQQTVISMTVSEVGNSPDVFSKTLEKINNVNQYLLENKEFMQRVLTSFDIFSAKKDRKLGILFNTQDSSMIGSDLDRVSILKKLGVRVIQLTYNNRNLSGDGCLEPENSGLSKLGHATIERIEAEEILLDLSHGGQRTVAEAIEKSKRPVTISHTGCRSLHDNPRNQWDAELKACADKGGVVGIYWMPFLVPNSKPRGVDLIRHMSHAKNVCGEDHVAVGTDNNLFAKLIDSKTKLIQKAFFEDRVKKGIAAPGEGPDIFNIVSEWDGYKRFTRLADGLSRDGWNSGAIEKALGGNLLRLYRDIWNE
jgi:membrane dipeptidase